jgi:hypothetical protein
VKKPNKQVIFSNKPKSIDRQAAQRKLDEAAQAAKYELR